jgi:hypothetical protein
MRGQGIGLIDKGPVITDTDQRLHYDFCGDLSIKTSYQQAFEYQPRFALFGLKQQGLTYAQTKKEETQEEGGPSVSIPTDLIVEIFDTEQAENVIEEAREKDDNLNQYKTDIEGEEEYEEREGKGTRKVKKEREILPAKMGNFLRDLLQRKLFLVMGCEEQVKAIRADTKLITTPSGYVYKSQQLALYNYSTDGEEKLFVKDKQMQE